MFIFVTFIQTLYVTPFIQLYGSCSLFYYVLTFIGVIVFLKGKSTTWCKMDIHSKHYILHAIRNL